MNQNNELASKIFAKLGDDNAFFSPYSIYIALSMVLEGASDEVKAEVMKSVGLTLKDKIRIEKVQQVVWEIANSLWHDNEVEIYESYKDTLYGEYGAEVMVRDFNVPRTIEEINEWVSKNTHGKIKDIIDNLSPLEKAVLINAIYFKAKWINPFPTKDTAPYMFLGTKGKQSVPMMNVEKEFKFIFDEMRGINLIEMPYRGGMISMVVVMPTCEEPLGVGRARIWSFCNVVLNEFGRKCLGSNESAVLDIKNPDQVKVLEDLQNRKFIEIQEISYKDGMVDKDKSPFQVFLNGINEEQISKWFKSLDARPSRKVRLKIPKFKMEKTIDLTSIVKDIGMAKMFEEHALDKIGRHKTLGGLYVSRILHKAYVDMDEEGTEAAAVTACVFRCKGMSSPSPSFIVDKPFVFFIRHNKTNTIMFMGKITSL